jgi:hypothetical protein
MRGQVSDFGTEESSADVGPCLIDAAAPLQQEFAAIVDCQFVWSVEGKLQASGSQFLEPLVLFPTDIYSSKPAAADTAALQTAIVAIKRCIKKNSVVSFFPEGREEHNRLSFWSQLEEPPLRSR